LLTRPPPPSFPTRRSSDLASSRRSITWPACARSTTLQCGGRTHERRMKPEINWLDLTELHVVKKLAHIVRRRFGVELGYANSAGGRVDGPADAASCARQALAAVGPSLRTTFFNCTQHQRREVASPILVDGALIG